MKAFNSVTPYLLHFLPMLGHITMSGEGKSKEAVADESQTNRYMDAKFDVVPRTQMR